MRMVRIGDVCKLITGGTPSRSRPEFFENGTIKWLVSGDINQVEIFDCDGRITEEAMKSSNTKILPMNSVMIALNGQGKTRGSVALLRTLATCNQSLVSISPLNESELLPEFLFHNLRMRYQELRRMTGDDGNDRRGLNMILIRDIQIPLPSLERQRAIVEKLDSAFAEIESLSERSNSMLLSANKMLSSLIASWVTGLSTGRSAKLGELAELKGRIGWRGLTAKEYTKTGPLFLSVHSLNHGHYVDFARAFHISQDRYDESPEIQVQEGYILIAKDGAGLGKVAMVGEVKEPTTVNSSLLVVKPNAQVRTKYLYCYFLSDAFKALIASRLGGSTVPHLYQRDIAQIPVALLEPDQQDEFIVRFDTSAELLDKLISNLEKRAKLILELKNSVLSHTFALVN